MEETIARIAHLVNIIRRRRLKATRKHCCSSAVRTSVVLYLARRDNTFNTPDENPRRVMIYLYGE
jgi:hypothetical protein